MADEETTTETTEETTTEEQPGTGTEVDWEADAKKWKNLARKHEDMWKASGRKPEELKQLVEAADRLAQAEEADKSEQQKLTDRLTKAEQDAAKTTFEAMRLRIALRLGLTEIQAKRLVGETEEDLEADARDLVASFAAPEADEADATDKSTARPKEKLKSGATPPSDDIPQLTREEVKRMSPEEIIKAKAEGRCNTLLGIK